MEILIQACELWVFDGLVIKVSHDAEDF